MYVGILVVRSTAQLACPVSLGRPNFPLAPRAPPRRGWARTAWMPKFTVMASKNHPETSKSQKLIQQHRPHDAPNNIQHVSRVLFLQTNFCRTWKVLFGLGGSKASVRTWHPRYGMESKQVDRTLTSYVHQNHVDMFSGGNFISEVAHSNNGTGGI